MKVFLDDVRDPCDVPDLEGPELWVVARTFEACIDLLEAGGVLEISLDHDLGTERTGYHVAAWLELAEQAGRPVPTTIYIHTANPIGRDRMCAALRRFADVRVVHASGRLRY